MRTVSAREHSGGMTPTGPPTRPATDAAVTTAPVPPPARLRPAPVLLLAVTALVGLLVVAISYALAREYADVRAEDSTVALGALRDWTPGLLLVTVLGAFVALTARGSRGRRALTLAAASSVLLTLVAVPASAVVGVHRKYDAMPRVPACTEGFTGGPAVPVVMAAQDAFDELDHPGPFGGGGTSGLDGCTSQLMARADVDVVAAYRRALPAAGWRLGTVRPDRVAATRDGQRFTASQRRDQVWWVRIGPASPGG